MAKSANGLTREQAAELYKDLQRNMQALKLKSAAGRASSSKSAAASKSVASEIAASIKEALRKDEKGSPGPAKSYSSLDLPSSDSSSASIAISEDSGRNGAVLAVMVLILAAAIKIIMGVMEFSGVVTVSPAMASLDFNKIADVAQPKLEPATPVFGDGEFSKEEVSILTSLDVRRAELDERRKQLDQRAKELDEKDNELTVRFAQLRDITEKLKIERDKGDKRRTAQLDQLSNVYGSMNPPEAAQLLEQLDIAIALELIERMPEKRIGQILALMKPEKALTITKMLSSKASRP